VMADTPASVATADSVGVPGRSASEDAMVGRPVETARFSIHQSTCQHIMIALPSHMIALSIGEYHDF
jgi:hypothetical protein